MADSFSAKLRLRLQQTGGNRNTWGGQLNSAALQLLEDSICGLADITVAGVDVTLSTASGANDQARMAILRLGGAPGGSRNIIVPAVSKLYIVINNTGFTQTVKTSAGAGVVVAVSARQYVMCDGTDVVPVQATSLGTVANADALGGVAAATYARKDTFNLFTKGAAWAFVTLTNAATVVLDATLSNNFFLGITGNRTLSITNATDGQSIELWVKQDATGGRTLTFPVNVEFDTDSASTLSGVPLGLDRVTMTYNVAQDLWKAKLGAAGDAVVTSLNITANTQDLDVYAMAGSPSGAVSITVTVSAGVVEQASSTITPAMDFAGFDSGSVINLINHGYILGKGGEGADGAFVATEFAGPGVITRGKAKAGKAGGPAIRGPGVGRTFNITNADGFIWGGGGGGGGGGATADSASGDMAAGGGGGAGAGASRGGRGATCGHHTTASIAGTDGSFSGAGTQGTFGAAGVGAQAGSADGGDGGDGGDWGTAGAAGDSPTTGVRDEAGGAGGAAGKAVNENGGTASFVSGGSGVHVKGAVV